MFTWSTILSLILNCPTTKFLTHAYLCSTFYGLNSYFRIIPGQVFCTSLLYYQKKQIALTIMSASSLISPSFQDGPTILHKWNFLEHPFFKKLITRFYRNCKTVRTEIFQFQKDPIIKKMGGEGDPQFIFLTAANKQNISWQTWVKIIHWGTHNMPQDIAALQWLKWVA